MKNNTFSKTLKKFLDDYGIKNAVLANELQYDESYISKWINGKSLPSKKNSRALISRISDYISDVEMEYSPKGGIAREEIRQTVFNELMAAYGEDESVLVHEKQNDNFYPLMSQHAFFDLLKDIRSDVDVALLYIFCLEHDVRMSVAGIENGYFIYDKPNKERKLSLTININPQEEDKEKLVYDSVFLIHMLTSLSNIDMRLYENEIAVGKAVYINKNRKYISGMIFPDDGVACVYNGNNREYAGLIAETVNHVTNSEKLVCEKTTMKDMLETKKYIHSLISVKIKWLMGHYTELLIPEDVFEEILRDNKIEDEDLFKEAHIVTNLTMGHNNTELLIYESAISKLAITGELDFYNRKIILNPGQREKCIRHLRKLIEDNPANFECKLIERGFSPDFQYITNPCLFISDSVYYLRLENGRYDDNICIIQNEKARKMYERFFGVVWSDREDTVLSDRSEILKHIDYYISSVKIIEKT